MKYRRTMSPQLCMPDEPNRLFGEELYWQSRRQHGRFLAVLSNCGTSCGEIIPMIVAIAPIHRANLTARGHFIKNIKKLLTVQTAWVCI
jgi:hypothetical protein